MSTNSIVSTTLVAFKEMTSQWSCKVKLCPKNTGKCMKLLK